MKQLMKPIRWSACSFWTGFLGAGLGIMLAAQLVAQSVPPLVNYQGRLANSDGSPFPTADYSLTVRLYDTSIGGQMIWGPQVFNGTNGLAGHGAKVSVVQGYFNLLLGPEDTNGAPLADAFNGAARYVEVTVSNRSSILPRQQILTTPFAFHAGTAAALASPPGMVLIPAGSFTMGNSVADTDITDATPISTTVSAFYMDVNEVTLSQWQSVYYWAKDHGYSFANAGAGKAATHPVQTVDWYDCVKWCNARSEQAGKTPVYYTDAGFTQVYTNGEPAMLHPNWTAKGYRLPTEAEWEKAARGGLSGQRFPWGNVINQNLANYVGATATYSYDFGPNSYNAIGSIGGISPATSPVGSFTANGYGLNDMAGNVWEWCWDWYRTPYAGGSDPHGPAGPLSNRVLRGGYWGNAAAFARCALRYETLPVNANVTLGFRCVCGL